MTPPTEQGHGGVVLELVADKLDALLNNDQKGEGSDGTE